RKEDGRALRGDLDRIVMKALQKSADRRYRSAEDFNEDIHRWLEGLPVRATPDSIGYQTRKFVSRNRAAVTVAGLVGALVISFGAVSMWQSRRIAKERDAAMSARGESEAVVAMLVNIFKLADPANTASGDSLRVGDLLDRADQELMQSKDTPRIRTKLWRTLAEVHTSRSRFDAQKRALNFALESARESGSEIDILAVQHEIARFVWRHEGPKAAEPLLRESLARHKKLLGPEAADVAIASQDLAGVVEDKNEKSALLADALAIQRQRFPGGTQEDSMGVASILNALGGAHYDAARFADAEVAFHESRAILEGIYPATNPYVLGLRSNEAMCLQSLGKYREAEAIHRELLEAKRRVFGDESAWVAESLDNLGGCLAWQGRHDEAVPVLREALAISEKVYGAGHGKTLWIMNDLGIALVRAGQVEEGFKMFDRTRPSAAGEKDDVTQIDFEVRRARLQLAAGESIPLDSLRNWVARIRATELQRPTMLQSALQVYGTGLLAAGGEANDSANHNEDAERVFAEAMTLSQGEADRTWKAMMCCGHELARAREGLAVDTAALTEAFEIYGPWGMADPRIVSGVRSILEDQG
ncbi:MAG TPA: tetratricopeptide repeat protein, partial [bacterium]|nr:tetratricopeptide repeat protein [bacterium]